MHVNLNLFLEKGQGASIRAGLFNRIDTVLVTEMTFNRPWSFG